MVEPESAGAALVAPSLVRARSKPLPNATAVDSGTFSILIDGRKVGTETFTIKQSPDGERCFVGNQDRGRRQQGAADQRASA